MFQLVQNKTKATAVHPAPSRSLSSAPVPSEAGKRRLQEARGEPLFITDWSRAVFIHYAVDPLILQPEVPFQLDVKDGRAFVSLVAFTMQAMRFRVGGAATAWMTGPIASHPFLNVRTYVVHHGEPGIHFLTEWLPNRLSVFLGRPLFGLPYRYGQLDFRHDPQVDRLGGCVKAVGLGVLAYRAVVQPHELARPAERNTLSEFLLERYTAFTTWWRFRRLFRVWHPAWPQMPIDVTVLEDSLLAKTCLWYPTAELVGGNYSPGVTGVWMGRPHRAS